MTSRPRRPRRPEAGLTTGGDYACRERVFAPPNGTLDVDWVTPAVVEAHPSCGPAGARAAVQRAWTAARAVAVADVGRGGPGRLDEVTAEAVLDVVRAEGVEPTDLDRTAAAVVLDAVRLFGVH